jgi:pilus assembly protein Flp/PilA
MKFLKYINFEVAIFCKREDGVTAIEYALIAALIAVIIIAGATSVGQAINAKFNNIASVVSGA